MRHLKAIEAFSDAILNGKPSPVSADQTLNVIRILDGLYRYDKAGREVIV